MYVVYAIVMCIIYEVYGPHKLLVAYMKYVFHEL